MKTTKVYHAPGYPLDPKKEEKRAWARLSEYQCILVPPQPDVFKTIIEIQESIDRRLGIKKEAE